MTNFYPSSFAMMNKLLRLMNPSSRITHIHRSYLAKKAFQPRWENCKSEIRHAPTLTVWEGMTIKELATLSNRPIRQILFTLNSSLESSEFVSAQSSKLIFCNKSNFPNCFVEIYDKNVLNALVKLMGFRPDFQSHTSKITNDRDAYPRPPCPPSECVARPPVVAVLGHVDHGKTTLLDSLRSSRVVDTEFGGITQHLGAFTVSMSSVISHSGAENLVETLSNLNSDCITFLDTPGHAAFSSIRARGALATDIVVLVVAADDGVKPQTVESIKFAKEAGKPIVVAINKMDKREADSARVVDGLATYGITVEQIGGEIQAVEISALQKTNLHGLMEALILQAELMQIRADPNGLAEALVLESKTEHGLGKTATCLVTRGQIKKTPQSGPLVSGEALCSPRIVLDDTGKSVNSVGPGFVVKIAGWKELPVAGSILLELESVARANEVIRYRRNTRMSLKAEQDRLAYDERMATYKAQYENFIKERSKTARSKWRFYHKHRPDLQSSLASRTDELTLPLTVKTDVHGSLEAVQAILSTCPSDQCRIDLCLAGVGPLTESEVEAAEAVGASILLFNVSALPLALQLAKEKGVLVKEFNIIYRLAEAVRDLIKDRLPPLIVEKLVGEAEILQLFEVKESRGSGRPLRVPVAGCRCTKGQLIAHAPKPGSTILDQDVGEIVATYYRVIRPNQHPQPSTKSTPNLANNPTADRSDLGSVLVDRASCRSLKHQRTVVESIRKGVECGLVLQQPDNTPQATSSTKPIANAHGSEQFYSNWQPGDVIQCYVLTKEPQKLDWEFETGSLDRDRGV